MSSAAQAAGQWTGARKIAKLYPHTDGLTVYLDGSVINNNGCGVNRFVVPISTTNYEVLASALITAYAALHNVTIYYDDGALGACQIPFSKVIVSP